jgi:hypothetical protein
MLWNVVFNRTGYVGFFLPVGVNLRLGNANDFESSIRQHEFQSVSLFVNCKWFVFSLFEYLYAVMFLDIWNLNMLWVENIFYWALGSSLDLFNLLFGKMSSSVSDFKR